MMKIPQDRFFVMVTYETLLEHMETIRRHRINCSVYLSAHRVLDVCERPDMEKIRAFFDENGLQKIVHGPFLDLNPGSLDKKIRDVFLARFMQTVEAARLLNAAYATFHSGYRPVPYKKYKDQWLRNSVETWKEAARAAEAAGVKINVENAFEASPELLIRLVEGVGSLDLRICFDAGHYNAFAKINPLEALEAIPPGLLGEIHLSDNDGSDDQHLPLGEGNIDIHAILDRVRKLDISPVFTLEPKDIAGAEKDLAYLRKEGVIG